MVRIKRIGLPNIVLNKDLLPEFIQDQATPDNLYSKTLELLAEPERLSEIRHELHSLKQVLGHKKTSDEMLKVVGEMLSIYG